MKKVPVLSHDPMGESAKSLRDEFAIAALTAILAATLDVKTLNPAERVRLAYGYADVAMLVREERP